MWDTLFVKELRESDDEGVFQFAWRVRELSHHTGKWRMKSNIHICRQVAYLSRVTFFLLNTLSISPWFLLDK